MTHIRPGRLALYILTLVFCAIPAVFRNDLYGYLPLLMLLLLGAVSGIYLALLRRRLSCKTADGAVCCVRCEELPFAVELINRSRLVFPRVDLIFYMEGQLAASLTESVVSVTLAPRERRNIPFRAVFDHVGEYAVGLRSAEVFGPMGIACVRLPLSAERRVLVTPRVWDMDGFPLSRQVTAEDAHARKSVTDDGMDYTGVRPYEPGDPLRSIHWKLSAHTREYLTKRQESCGSAGLTVVLDLRFCAEVGETALTMLDALIESAVSICRFAGRGGADCEIAYFDQTGSERRFVPRRDDSYFSLVAALPSITEGRERYPTAELLRHAGNNNVILCSADPSEELTRLLRQLHSQKKHVTLVHILPAGQTERERDEALAGTRLLTAAGIDCFAVTSAEELRSMGG